MSNTNDLTRRRFLGCTLAAGAASLAAGRSLAAAEPALPYFQDRGWLVGCWTRPWAQYDYRVGFDAIREAGFRYVALTGAKTRTKRVIALQTTLEEAAEVGREARARGLTITNVYGGGVPLDKGPDALRKMIDLCEAAGAWSVLLSGIGNEANYADCCRTVADCCEYAAGKRIAIVLKPHGGTTGTGPLLRDAWQRVAHKAFTIMYDPGNIFFYSDGKIDPVADCQAVLGLVTGVSVKDYRPPREVMFTPGTGQVDFPALFSKLRRGGFTHGPLAIEALTPGSLAETLAEAKRAKQFVEGLVK